MTKRFWQNLFQNLSLSITFWTLAQHKVFNTLYGLYNIKWPHISKLSFFYHLLHIMITSWLNCLYHLHIMITYWLICLYQPVIKEGGGVYNIKPSNSQELNNPRVIYDCFPQGNGSPTPQVKPLTLELVKGKCCNCFLLFLPFLQLFRKPNQISCNLTTSHQNSIWPSLKLDCTSLSHLTQPGNHGFSLFSTV